MNPEKNDISIEKLFHWGKEFELFDRYNNITEKVWMRLVGDAEINRARVFAIRKSADLRKQLKDPDSDYRIAFVSAIYDIVDQEHLIKLIGYLQTKKFSQDAVRDIRFPSIKEPKSTATLEEQEQYQAQVDAYEQKRQEKLTQYVVARLEESEQELKGKDLSVLQKQYEKLMIDELCENEMVEKFRDCCVYFGTYRDEAFRERYFKEFDEFANLPTEFKDQLVENYTGLEVNVQELKKLLEATP